MTSGENPGERRNELRAAVLAAAGDGIEALSALVAFDAGLDNVRRPAAADLREWLRDRLEAGDGADDQAGRAQAQAALAEAQERLLASFEDAPEDAMRDAVLDGEPLSLVAVHRGWKQARAAARDSGRRPLPKPPAAPLIREWFGVRADPAGVDKTSAPVATARRFDSRVLPKIEFPADNDLPKNENGVLFGGLTFGPGAPPCKTESQLPLPCLPASDEALLSVPVLDIVDYRGRPVTADSRSAPWALRLHVGAQLVVPIERRPEGGGEIVLTPTLAELRRVVTNDNFRPSRDWDRFRQALKAADGYWMQGLDSAGRLCDWKALSFTMVPRDYADDARVRMVVCLPAGCNNGPPINLDAFRGLSLNSAPRFRAYIAAACLTWVSGRTKVPPKQGSKRRVWARDPGRYPVISRRDRHRLAFGIGAVRHSDERVDGAWTGLPGFTVVDRDASDERRGVTGWRVMPDGALEPRRGPETC